jgi:hypothetical protein
MGPDGLLTVRPRRNPLRMPWRGILLSLAALLILKAALHAHLGGEAYAEKIAQLQVGSMLERAGAWMMAPDWLTQELAAQIAPFLG